MDNLKEQESSPPEKQFNRTQFEQARNLERYFPATNLIKSFGHAIYGVKETWACQRNFKIHTLCALAVVFLATVLKVDSLSWLFLILAISLVLTTELINTAIEHVVDLAANTAYHPLAKAAKDAAAGAVLIAAASSVISGLIIFTPYLTPLFQQTIKIFWP